MRAHFLHIILTCWLTYQREYCIFYFPGPGGKTVGLVLGVLLLIAFVITAGLLYYFKCRKKPTPSKSIGGNGEEMAFTGVQNNSEQMAHNETPTQPDS